MNYLCVFFFFCGDGGGGGRERTQQLGLLDLAILDFPLGFYLVSIQFILNSCYVYQMHCVIQNIPQPDV